MNRLPRPAALVLKSLCLLAFSTLPALADWQPVAGKMMTKWGKELKPDAVWQEYPRPQLERASWTNLNGLWDFSITPKDASQPAEWTQKILVPFCPESTLSGIGHLTEPSEALWYKRSLPGPAEGKRTLLNFEAVDYIATVWVNGQSIGIHTGGSTAFSFDITSALKPAGNELVLRAYDATENAQLSGKQRLKAEGIFYTRVSGIWQTVWLETVAERSIQDLDFVTDIKVGSIEITPKLRGTPIAGEKIRATATRNGQAIIEGNGVNKILLTLPNAKLWSPNEPNLYDLKVELLDANGQVVDSVKSYFALREIGKVKDVQGHWRFTLNGKSIFHWGPLDQGWWPDGLLTPPSDAAMNSDVDFLKAAGFNMIRKHIKIEPRRYYQHCDKVGMLVWQDQVCMANSAEAKPAPWTRLSRDPKEGVWPAEAQKQFATEYRAMVDQLRKHPSIVVWDVFNEAFGQHDTLEVGKMAVEYDKTRLVNVASGGNFWPVGDVADDHQYPAPGFPLGDLRFDEFIKVVGEFGGHGMAIPGHLWDKNSPNWGYDGLPKNLDEWKSRYAQSTQVLKRLRSHGISGGVYTQTTDVESEINGLMTYDREQKVPISWLKPSSDQLLAAPDHVKITTLLPTSEHSPQASRFVTTAPGPGWGNVDFDDSAWSSGSGGYGHDSSAGNAAGTATEWKSSDIWIRREFDLPQATQGFLILRLFHDDGAEVYLNGSNIAAIKQWSTCYQDHFINNPKLLRAGKNVIAIHCHQDRLGQYIDAGLMIESAD
jgi:Glycosyl hydrolases family 2/Glycosyl hydrolases family 2, sugar binding domain/Glycosyl hydrolases family 2, TIM barrel domain